MVSKGNVLSKPVGDKIASIRKEFLAEVSRQVRNRVTSPDVVEILFNMVQGKLSFIGGAYFNGVEDHTDPNNWVGYFRDEIAKNLKEAEITVAGTSIKVTITLLSDEFLGIDTKGPTDKHDPTPVRWLYYFIFGNLENDLYWVPKSEAHKLGKYLGRFSKGYLLKRSEETIAELRESRGLKVEVHPQSGGKSFPNLFESILTDQLINEIIIEPAVQAATAIVFSS